MSFTLPPEPQPRTIDEFDIPPELDAYFKRYFQATKKTGESQADFIIRNMAIRAMQWHKDDLDKTEDLESTTTKVDILLEFQAALETYNLED